MEACLYLCVYSYCTVCEDFRFTCMYIYVHTYMHTCVVLYGVCQFCQEGVIISRNDALFYIKVATDHRPPPTVCHLPTVQGH